MSNCEDLDSLLMLTWGECCDFFLHSVGNSGVHGGTSGQDDVSVQFLSDVNITLHDRVVGGLVDSSGLSSDEGGLEEGLRGSKSLVSDGDDLNDR